MIVFDLACSNGHRFEGWFASSDEYARQRERKLVSCPMCDDAAIERIPSARVNVSKGVAPSPPQPAASAPAGNAPTANVPAPTPGGEAVAGVPAEMLVKLREFVKSFENVGRRFAEEARKIHYDEAPARPIRGQASPEEAKALEEEGIEFSSLPPFLGEGH
jgi:hypothetical protein